MIIDLSEKDRRTTIEFENESGQMEEENAIILFEFEESGNNFIYYLMDSNEIIVMKIEDDGETLSLLEEDEEEIAADVLDSFLNENEFHENGKVIDIFERIVPEEEV